MRLETERLLLRPLSLDDLDMLAGFYADPEVMEYIGAGQVIDRDSSRQSLERMIVGFEAEGSGQLAVERKEDGAFMGRCGLLLWDTASWTPTRRAESKGPVETESATSSAGITGATATRRKRPLPFATGPSRTWSSSG